LVSGQPRQAVGPAVSAGVRVGCLVASQIASLRGLLRALRDRLSYPSAECTPGGPGLSIRLPRTSPSAERAATESNLLPDGAGTGKEGTPQSPAEARRPSRPQSVAAASRTLVGFDRSSAISGSSTHHCEPPADSGTIAHSVAVAVAVAVAGTVAGTVADTVAGTVAGTVADTVAGTD